MPSSAKWISTLSRVTSSGNYIPEIDGLRFVAISGVLFTHIWSIWSAKVGASGPESFYDHAFARIFSAGAYGVELFFMISGFILALPFLQGIDHQGKPVALGPYFLRRVTRLEPPYVVSMILFFVFGVLAHKYTFHDHWGNFLASLCYVHNVAYRAGSLINNNAWSLEIEVQFYVLVPVLVWAFRARPFWRRLLLTVSIVLFTSISLSLPPAFPKILLGFFQYFLAGMLLSDLYLSFLKKRSGGDWRYDLLAVLVWLAILVSTCLARFHVLGLYALPFLFLAYAICVFCGRWVRAVHTFPVLTLIGGMCYSIYLLHARIVSIPIAFGLCRWLPFHGTFLSVIALAVVILPLVVVLSALFFLLIEKPCMQRDWPQRLARFFRAKFSPTPRGAA